MSRRNQCRMPPRRLFKPDEYAHVLGGAEALCLAFGWLDTENRYEPSPDVRLLAVRPVQDGELPKWLRVDLGQAVGYSSVDDLLDASPDEAGACVAAVSRAELPMHLIGVTDDTPAHRIREECFDPRIRNDIAKSARCTVLCFNGWPAADAFSDEWVLAGRPKERVVVFNVEEGPSFNENGGVVGGKRARTEPRRPCADDLLAVTGAECAEALTGVYRMAVEGVAFFDATEIAALREKIASFSSDQY